MAPGEVGAHPQDSFFASQTIWSEIEISQGNYLNIFSDIDQTNLSHWFKSAITAVDVCVLTLAGLKTNYVPIGPTPAREVVNSIAAISFAIVAFMYLPRCTVSSSLETFSQMNYRGSVAIISPSMKPATRTLLAALLAFTTLPALSQQAAAPRPHTFTIEGDHFALDGKPFKVLSGELHYARIPREYWHARLKMARAMGLNTIATYVFWNVHEPTPGHFDFTGNNDLVAFIKAAQQEGLYVILRAGPYSCAEWEFGGFPAWLLKDPRMSFALRTDDPATLADVTNFCGGRQAAGPALWRFAELADQAYGIAYEV